MDMVNDGKDIRLDTPQAVKEALASGKDLYNPQTGEFWWEYNDTGSIANTYVHLDDPNLLAVIDNPDFDLFEDIVGGLSYTGYITDSIETIIEHGEENAPLIDPREDGFAHVHLPEVASHVWRPARAVYGNPRHQADRQRARVVRARLPRR